MLYEIKKLKINSDQRGSLIEILRSDDKIFKGFGQVYITYINPGETKGGHYHKGQYDYFFVVKGCVSIELDNGMKKINYSLKADELICVSPYIKHTFKNCGNDIAICVGITTEPYNQKNPDTHYNMQITHYDKENIQ